jgi:hypothetical protein
MGHRSNRRKILVACLVILGCGSERPGNDAAITQDVADDGSGDGRLDSDLANADNAAPDASLDRVADSSPDVAPGPDVENDASTPLDAADGDGDGDGSAGDGGSFCPGCSMVTLPIYGEHLVYDPGRRRLYVTVGSSFAGEEPKDHADSLVIVDPASATVTGTLPLGRHPGPLALSDDGSTLWAGIGNDNAVRKVTLDEPPVVGPLIPLPRNAQPDSPRTARTIAVLPGSRTTVVIGAYASYGSAAFILDDGVPRPTQIGGSTAPPLLLTNGPPGYLFGVTELNDLVVVKVASDGLMQTRFRGLLGQYVNNLIYTGTQLFATQGEVIDVSNLDMPRRAGTFAFWGSIAVINTNRWLMLSEGPDPSGPAWLRVLDPQLFTSVSSVTLPAEVRQSGGRPRDLVYLGGDGVAFLAKKTDNRMYLFIVHAPEIAP